MFRFHKTLDIVTLFHKASSPASVRVASLLKQASAAASGSGAPDAGSPPPPRSEFELNITEEPPTADQLRTILEYVGQPAIPSVVKGARTETEALRRFKESSENFQRPVVVDWNNGKAFSGSEESEILKLLKSSSS